MASGTLWTSPEGAAVLQSVVLKLIPSWKHGLRPRQLEPIQCILDGKDVILCTATGDGKSALFTVPILVHRELSRHPDAYPHFAAIRRKPVGIVITPTKGLAGNIVLGLRKHGIRAVAFDRETIACAASQKRKLEEEIGRCEYDIVCVDPEHLSTPPWRRIFDFPEFIVNLLFICIEEGHLVGEWLAFRPCYGAIGPFIRGRVPPHVSTFTISATIEPGRPIQTLCKLVGFRDYRLSHIVL